MLLGTTVTRYFFVSFCSLLFSIGFVFYLSLICCLLRFFLSLFLFSLLIEFEIVVPDDLCLVNKRIELRHLSSSYVYAKYAHSAVGGGAVCRCFLSI